MQGLGYEKLKQLSPDLLEALCNPSKTTQRLQYPSIEEYSLNHIRDPTIIDGIFLN